MLEGVSVQDFSRWDGTPFFTGYPKKGRRVYLDRREDKFTAYGVVEPSPQCVFQARGTSEELERFLAQVKDEGAQVTHGPPPFEVKTGGDKPPTSGGTQQGVKGSKPQ